MLLTGVITGVLTFIAMVLLIEKMPPWLRAYIYGHNLLSDVLFTMIAYLFLPVVGTATMIATAIFCVAFSVYLAVMKSYRPSKTLYFKWRKKDV